MLIFGLKIKKKKTKETYAKTNGKKNPDFGFQNTNIYLTY